MSKRDDWDADDEGWKDDGPDPDVDVPAAADPIGPDDPDYLGPEYDEDLDAPVTAAAATTSALPIDPDDGEPVDDPYDEGYDDGYDDGGPVDPPPPGGYGEDGGNRRWLLITALVAVLLLGVAAAVVVAGGSDDDDGRESADLDTDASTTTSTTRELGLPGASSSTTIGITTSTTGADGAGTGGSTSTTARTGTSTTRPTTATSLATVAPLAEPCGPRGVSEGATEANKPARIQICTDSLPARGTSMKFYVNVVDEDATISRDCVDISFEGEPLAAGGCAPHAPTGDFNDTLSFTHTFTKAGTYTVRAAVVSEPQTAKGSAATTSFTFTVV